MTAVRTIDFDRLQGVSDSASDKESAREVVVGTIRLVESKLVAALAGTTLRGLSNLAPPWHPAPYYAQRVHVAQEGVRYRGLPKGGHAVLVVSKYGKIVLARVVGEGVVEEREIADEELCIEDCEPIARTVAEVVDRHIERMDRTSEARERALSLARRLAVVLRG